MESILQFNWWLIVVWTLPILHVIIFHQHSILSHLDEWTIFLLIWIDLVFLLNQTHLKQQQLIDSFIIKWDQNLLRFLVTVITMQLIAIFDLFFILQGSILQVCHLHIICPHLLFPFILAVLLHLLNHLNFNFDVIVAVVVIGSKLDPKLDLKVHLRLDNDVELF